MEMRKRVICLLSLPLPFILSLSLSLSFSVYLYPLPLGVSVRGVMWDNEIALVNVKSVRVSSINQEHDNYPEPWLQVTYPERPLKASTIHFV